MGLATVVLVGAAVLAGLLGGSLSALARLRFRGSRLVGFAVAGQVLGAGMAWATNEHGFYPVGLAISALAGFAFCARNIDLAGVPLITLGLAANALVVGLNGSMPVSASAAARAGVPTAGIAAGEDARHEIADHRTRLRPLGDVIAVPLPWRPEVSSPGDLLVAAGLAELVFAGMRPRRRRVAVPWANADEETSWPRRSASAGLEPRARPTTASARTPERARSG
jgi:hypothetical protein